MQKSTKLACLRCTEAVFYGWRLSNILIILWRVPRAALFPAMVIVLKFHACCYGVEKQKSITRHFPQVRTKVGIDTICTLAQFVQMLKQLADAKAPKYALRY